MKFILKITLGISIFLACFVGIGILMSKYENYQESKFHNIQIPKNLKIEKTIKSLTNQQLDSIKRIKVYKDKIIIIGNGLSSYNFFIWHKSKEKGEIFIKAFELTQNIQLSELELYNGTKKEITELNNQFNFYKGNSTIYEGTFGDFYPTRFELWFKSEKTGIEKKMTEKSYLIDGWDR